MLDETLGKVHFWGTILSFNGIFIPLFVLGMAGQHRRIYDFTNFPDLATPELQVLRIIATASLVILMVSQIPFFINFYQSLRKGEKAPNNPWKANTLEWTVPSPPPHGNFGDQFPTVYRGPYEYSHPDRESDYWPQNEPN